jgi:hypothetical protein
MAGLWGANARRVSQGRFRVVGCRAFRPDLEEGLGGETEETALFLPIMAADLCSAARAGSALARWDAVRQEEHE